MNPQAPNQESGVLPILKTSETKLKAQVPSFLNEAMPKESPSNIFSDYLKTGNSNLKAQAGQALNKLSSFVNSVPKVSNYLSGTTNYNRQSFLSSEGVPQSVPDRYKQFFAENSDEVATPEILGTILNHENRQGNPHATNLNKDGTTDYGLMQINSSNLETVRKEFKNQGSIFNPYDPSDSIKAASIILKENASIFKQKTGRMPTKDEMWDVYNHPVEAAKEVVAQQKKQEQADKS